MMYPLSSLCSILCLMVLPICAMEFFNKSWPENFICNFDAFDKLTIETAIDSHWKDPEKLCQPGPYPKRCTYTTDEPWGKKNQTLIIYIHYERLKDRTGDFKSADWKIGHHVGKKFVIDHEQGCSYIGHWIEQKPLPPKQPSISYA